MLHLSWPVLTRPVPRAAEVCFGNGQYDHCGVDRRRRNYWVRAPWANLRSKQAVTVLCAACMCPGLSCGQGNNAQSQAASETWPTGLARLLQCTIASLLCRSFQIRSVLARRTLTPPAGTTGTTATTTTATATATTATATAGTTPTATTSSSPSRPCGAHLTCTGLPFLPQQLRWIRAGGLLVAHLQRIRKCVACLRATLL